MTHRIIQAFDTAQFLENTRGDCRLQILAGDLNTEPQDLAYRVLLSTSAMKDSYNMLESEQFATHECINNTYTSQEIKENGKKSGIRIDYILYRSSSEFECEIEKYELPLLNKIPSLNISYSDHEAVHAKITITNDSRRSSNHFDKSLIIENIKNLKECITTCNKSLKALEYHRRYYSMIAVGLGVILINVLEITPSYGFKTIYFIIKLLFVVATLFCAFMASLWNMMERHGILAGKLAMEIALGNNELALKN